MFEFGRFIDFEGRRDSDHPQHTSRCGRIDIADKKQLIDGLCRECACDITVEDEGKRGRVFGYSAFPRRRRVIRNRRL